MTYVPARPRFAQVAGSSIEPVKVSVDVFTRTTDVTLRVTGAPVKIVRLMPTGSTPSAPTECSTAGVPEDVVRRSVATRGDVVAELPRFGAGELSAGFAVTYVDADGLHCVAFPLASPRPSDRWVNDDFTAFALRGEYLWYSAPLGNLNHRFELSLGVGRWVDTVLVAGSLGIAGSVCSRSLCPAVESAVNGETRTSDRVAGGPVVALEASTWPLQYGVLTAGIGGRYSVSEYELTTYSGSATHWVHGPRVVPKIGLSESPYIAPGFPAGPRVSVIELEAPVGISISENNDVVAAYGVALRIGITVW